jgi:hypothetical protein
MPLKTLMNEFSLLSLNTFGIPFYLSWGRLRRLTRQLERFSVTAICLQEIQQNAYTQLIQRCLTSYPHAVYEPHLYAPKGGLAIFSRLPLIDKGFEVYADRGSWYSISYSDWALYKGIQCACFNIAGMPVTVLHTHMNANYAGVWQQSNRLSRILYHQVKQLNQAIRSFPEESLIVLCGDFNFPRNSFLYEELIAVNNLIDPLLSDERPSYRPFPLVPSKWKTSLDYVLVRQPAKMTIDIQADVIKIEDTTKHLPIQRFLTDHNALLLRITGISPRG